MRLKKFFALGLVFSLVLSINSASAQINNIKDDIVKNGNVVFKAERIVDDKVILERMEKGITDDKAFRGNSNLSTERISDEDGNEFALRVESTKCTSQKIKEIANDSGDSVSEYSADIIATINMIPIIKSIASGGGIEEIYKWDMQTTGVKMYVKVTYESGMIDSYSVYKVTAASGKLEVYDTPTSLTNISINEYIHGGPYTSVTGNPIDGGSHTYNCTASASNPTSGSYYNHTGLSPYAYKMGDGSLSVCQCIVTGSFKRGTSTWSDSVTWSRNS